MGGGGKERGEPPFLECTLLFTLYLGQEMLCRDPELASYLKKKNGNIIVKAESLHLSESFQAGTFSSTLNQNSTLNRQTMPLDEHLEAKYHTILQITDLSHRTKSSLTSYRDAL